jgi:hypothetical protein
VSDVAPGQEAAANSPSVTVSISAIAWTAVGIAFVLLRLGPIWQAPVGGAELIHLSGAWQARIGLPDDRFAPTLFQALSALVLHGTTSEVGPRLFAFLATATIPAALYLLRPRLGNAGALLALVLLALDPPAISLGVSASALGFDLAIAIWLCVLVDRAAWSWWAWFLGGFLVATAGPLPLPLVFALVAARLLTAAPPRYPLLALGGAGVSLGVLATSLRFGLGWDGLRVVPFDLFARGFDQPWASGTGVELIASYGLPTILAGSLAAVWQLRSAGHRWPVEARSLDLALWIGAAAAWLWASSQSHNPVPLAALTTPLALLVGPLLARALNAMVRADWTYARLLLPIAGFAATLSLAVAVDWARNERVGDGGQKFVFAATAVVAVSALVILLSSRTSRPTLLAAGLVVAAAPALAGTFGVALSASHEPIPSPLSTAQARELRDIALETVRDRGGLVVVHPSLRDDLTWAFRDSGTIVVSSRIPADAGFVVWPLNLPRPEGFVALEGRWVLKQEVEPPTGGGLQYLRWLIDRHSVQINPSLVAVYVKAKE